MMMRSRVRLFIKQAITYLRVHDVQPYVADNRQGQEVQLDGYDLFLAGAVRDWHGLDERQYSAGADLKHIYG
jgi:hypothetical protein